MSGFWREVGRGVKGSGGGLYVGAGCFILAGAGRFVQVLCALIPYQAPTPDLYT